MNLKKIIIILIVLVLIFLIILGILLMNVIEQETEFDPPMENIEVEINKELSQVNSLNDYYAVKTCINKFYQFLTLIDSEEDMDSEQYITSSGNTNQQAIYDMLDSRYIQYKNITLENIFDIIPRIEESNIIIDEMYVSQKDANMSVYVVNGRLSNNITREKQNFNIIVEVDMKNRTFKLLLDDYIAENITNLQLGEEIDLDSGDMIEKNTYNTFDYENISEETYVTDMFNTFRNNMVYDFEEVYVKLASEYKESRFVTYEDFEEYARSNARKSLEMELAGYQKNEFGDYTQYIFLDQKGNYYIFNTTSVNNFSIMLDTYTVDLPQFLEEYNAAEDSRKVILNLQKVFEALNRGDYSYVYNKLDETFRNNNFPTLEEFEEYISNTLFERNNVSYEEYQTRGNLHIYKLIIADEENNESQTVEKEFIMQLQEGTDFVMSFEV